MTLASVSRIVDGKPEREYRPVAFDKQKKRYLSGRLTERGRRPRRSATSPWPTTNTGCPASNSLTIKWTG